MGSMQKAGKSSHQPNQPGFADGLSERSGVQGNAFEGRIGPDEPRGDDDESLCHSSKPPNRERVGGLIAEFKEKRKEGKRGDLGGC